MAPFGSSHLPLTHSVTESERSILMDVTVGLPERWLLVDRVLVVIMPAFRQDVERFYEGVGGDITTLMPEHVLPRLDEELTKKALTLVLSLHGQGSGGRRKPIRHLVERKPKPRRKLQGRVRGEATEPNVSLAFEEGTWVVRLLPAGQLEWGEAREASVIRTMQAVAARQLRFLEDGLIALVPMSRVMLARDVGLSESTVSRIVGRVVIQTPLGRFILSDLFDTGVSVDTGGLASVVAAKAALLGVIQSEEASAPLSDSDLVLLMKHFSFVLARRTVAKYRSQMGIPDSRARGVPGGGSTDVDPYHPTE